MSVPDFQISAGLRARQLTSHGRPDAETGPDSDRVRVTRTGRRRGIPQGLEPGGRYANVHVEVKIVGRVADDDVSG